MSPDPMVRVGVTGGIGSGKSTVCRVWEKLGADVVYADKLAKKLMTENSEVREKIRSRFGARVYRKDGTLDRKYLAEVAFAGGRVGELNRIVHPVVRAKMIELMKRAENSGAEMFVEEAALLLSNGRPAGFDYIVFVTADKEDRIEWVTKRDHAGRKEVLDRMKRQQAEEDLLPLCDFIIENRSTLGDLVKKAEGLYWKMLTFEREGTAGKG